jgi:IS5 family transposase
MICDSQRHEEGIMKQTGFFDLSDHLEQFSSAGYALEELQGIIDFEAFRPNLEDALDYSDGTKGGRPPYDPAAMFKAWILAAQINVSGVRMEYLIRDHLSWPRFLGFDLGKPAPDENTDPQFSRKTDPGGRDQDAFRWV